MKEIKTKNRKVVNEQTLLVAIDISKDRHTGYFRCPDGSDTKSFDFYNNGRGFALLWERICKVKKTHGLEKIVAGLESTGPYGEPLIHYLRSKGVRVVQVNPLHTKRLKELTGNSPGKTDYKDPRVIADIVQLGHALTVIVPEGAAAELRKLTQARERAMQRRITFVNQLQCIVFHVFPEFLQVMKDIKSKSARHLLKHYPLPEALAKCRLEELTGILKRVSRGKLGKTRAQALIEVAAMSIGIKEGQRSVLLEIREMLSQIEAVEQFIGELEKEMSCFLKEIPYSHCLLSMKGIGEVTAAGIIGEVGDFRAFRTIPEIEKLAGLDLFEISSGKHKGTRRISKRGRSLLRKLLFFAAINTIRKGGIMHEPYQRYLGNGMPKMKALIAIARKLIGVMFALVRNHSEYISDYRNPELMKLAA